MYQDDLNPEGNLALSDEFMRERLGQNEDLITFARSLLLGVRQRRVDLDAVLSQVADNWRLERMAVTDRNLLRLGAYEIIYGGTPGRVAINEALELAKRYGAKQSPQFVNGLLDRILQREEKDKAAAKKGAKPPGQVDGED